MSCLKKITALSILSLLSFNTFAAQITFDFTGRLVVADLSGSIVGPAYTPIAATLTYDTISGFGNSDLSIMVDDPFFGAPVTFHDITMDHIEGTNLINGNVMVDWNGNNNMPMQIQWDATGLFNAIDYGLQEGHVLSGSDLYYDSNGNGIQDTGEFIQDINSATPYSDSLQTFSSDQQGPAPMAVTSASIGVTEGPFEGVVGYLDIGSGNSMHVTSVSAVPVPAAVWLFASGLLGLAGIARRK